MDELAKVREDLRHAVDGVSDDLLRSPNSDVGRFYTYWNICI